MKEFFPKKSLPKKSKQILSRLRVNARWLEWVKLQSALSPDKKFMVERQKLFKNQASILKITHPRCGISIANSIQVTIYETHKSSHSNPLNDRRHDDCSECCRTTGTRCDYAGPAASRATETRPGAA